MCGRGANGRRRQAALLGGIASVDLLSQGFLYPDFGGQNLGFLGILADS